MIYLDLDGPMVDWDGGVYELYKKPRVTPKPGEKIHEILNVKKTAIWEKIRKAGAKWWVNLKPQPWAKNLYDELCSIDKVIILSSPSHLPEAAAGKTQWMKDFFGGNFREYILTSRKDLLAKPGDVLIDDTDDKIEEFNKAGGIGVVFPRMWNKDFKNTDNAVNVVLEKLSIIYPHYKSPHLRVEENEEYEFSSTE